MKFTEKSIGPNLIEIITSGLYDGNQNCLREYVQNSIDSHATNIDICFENGYENLIIKDDGSGMSKKELMESLNIGISHKTEEDTGWRGIGIWSGVPACKRIVVITKKKNDKKYRIEINNDKIRDGIGDKEPLLEILSSATGDPKEMPFGADDSFENDHFTIVRLESILKTQKDVFKDKTIRDYLVRFVPAPFDNNNFSFAGEIDKWLKEKGVKFPTVNINFGDEREPIFRPPHRDDIFINKITKQEFKVGGKLVAVGWALTSIENQQLEGPNKGIFFKKKGYTIGNENLVRNLYDKTYHFWQYGEIHIISEAVRENAARNNFEYNSGVVGPFFDEVGKFIGSLQGVNRVKVNKNLEKKINSVKGHLEKRDVKSAKKALDKLKDNVCQKINVPDDPIIQDILPMIDAKFETDKKVISELEEEVKKEPERPDMIKIRKEQLNNIIDLLPPDVRKKCNRTTMEGKLYPEMSVTDSIKDILKDKTGLAFNEVYALSKAAYGWDNISKIKTSSPILCLDKNKTERNLRLGVMIYTIHDIFVNLAKHEEGKESFKWFENATLEEKYELAAGMYAIIGLIYRLIEKSENCQP